MMLNRSLKIAMLSVVSLSIMVLPIFSSVLQDREKRIESLQDGNPEEEGNFRPFYFTSGNYLAYRNLSEFDADGVILANYSGKLEYNPLLIARYAAEIYHYWYRTSDSSPLPEFRNQISWLRENETKVGDHSIWLYRFNLVCESQPWWSSLANGFVIAAFISSYVIDEDPEDLTSAWRALEAYRYPMEEHGLSSQWEDTIWYEELASNCSSIIQNPSHILNGFVYSLGAPYYIFEFNGSSEALSIFNDGIFALKKHMSKFDTGMWQRYSMTNPRAYPAYLDIHRYILEWAAEASEDEEILYWYERTIWMINLPSSGFTPVEINATGTISDESRVNHLFDKKLYDGFWSATVPASITIDLGVEKEFSFVGYFAPYYYTAPRNWSLYSGIDGINWTHRATIVDSFEYDKAVVFDEPINARYVKFEIENSVGALYLYRNIVSIDEIVISNPSPDELEYAITSIREHRFNHTYGQIQFQVPNGTKVRIDNRDWVTVSHNYSVWLETGFHNLSFDFQGELHEQSVFVEYAKSIYVNWSVNLTDPDSPSDNLTGSFCLLAGIAIALAIVVYIYSLERKKLS